jgi:alpha-tubulin suppressor-like RCC1 family protein
MLPSLPADARTGRTGRIEAPLDIVATTISAGGDYSCAISGGKAYCWGDNADGELGNGTTTSSSTPVPVSTSGVLSGKTLVQIAAGNAFTCALDNSKNVYCWGRGTSGQLGNGSNSSSLVPVAIVNADIGNGSSQIAAGGATACTAGGTTPPVRWAITARPMP